MLKLISSLFSYLKKERKIQVISKILFSSINKGKRIQVLSGIIFLFLIVIIFSIQDSSESNKKTEEKTSEQIKEKNIYTPESLSKNNEVEIKKGENKQLSKDELSKSTKSLEKKPKKVPSKNKLETPQKNEVKQLTKKPTTKNGLKNSNTPKEVVNYLHIGLKKVSEKVSDSPSDLINLVKNTYNVEKMIAKIIGDTWKKTNEKDQEEIVIIFQEYIAKNYFNRFKKIKNPIFNYKESKKIGEKFMLVKTDLVVDKEEVSISYLLSLDKNKWRIFDVLLAGSISEIATKKSEFSAFISDGKITPLIDALKKQNLILDN